MVTTSKCRVRSSLTAVVSISLLLPAAAAFAAAPRHPMPGVDPLTEIVEVESRSATLRRWVSRGFKQAVLVYFDTVDGLGPLGKPQEAALAELRKVARGGSTGQARRNPAFENRFATAAVSLGIVREAYWVMPYDYFRSSDPAGLLRSDLRKAGFLEEDLRTFALRDGCFRGTVRGTPFAVCGLEALPRISEPILLSFDADYLISAAAAGATNPILEIRKLVAALAAGRYAALDVVLCAAVEHGPVRPDLRWVGETLMEVLRDPALLSRPDSAKRWNLLQSLGLLHDAGNFFEIIHQVSPFMTIHEDDPALQLYAAAALAGQGRLDEALARGRTACQLHPGYCCGLPWIGLQFFAAGDIESGERFFTAGAQMRPDMVYGQVVRGLVLQRAGLSAAALKVFQALSDADLAFPSGFLAGSLLVRAGDLQGAVRQFDRALEALKAEPDSAVSDLETAHAVRDAARLYRQEGRTGDAETLENNPRLRFTEPEVQPGSP